MLDATTLERALTTALVGGLIFVLCALTSTVAAHPGMFTGRFARRHRLFGLALLCWLLLGFADALRPPERPLLPRLLYDVVLGTLGTATTLSAAADFRVAHAKAENVASGTLAEEATVTHNEMVEHAFYQLLNLAQILYLHALAAARAWAPWQRAALALGVTLPWCWRGSFPVNSFSANYHTAVRVPGGAHVGTLYRIKKAQYLLYKHALLHGLNLSAALDGLALPGSRPFQLYWMCLNTSYVMEFFLQTLVKRGYLAQPAMLRVQRVLMAVSTATALRVLLAVRPSAVALSLALNLARRGRELSNVALVLAALLAADNFGAAGGVLRPMGAVSWYITNRVAVWNP